MTDSPIGGTPKRKKLLVVIGTLARIGGAERQALYLVEHLRGLPNCEVEVLAFEDGDVIRAHLDALGVRLHLLPYYFRWPRPRRARTLAKLAWLLRSTIKPDALLPFVGIHSKTMAQVWPYTNAQFCWWNQQDEGRDLTGTPVERKILHKVSRILSNSYAGSHFLAETYGLDLESILVYNNGTPVPVDAPIPSTWRQHLGLGNRQIVSMIANITSYKDHVTLLRAWARVRDHFVDGEPPALLLAGTLAEPARVSKLKMLAFDVGLSSTDVFFLGGVNDVDDLILESDLVVHSSLTEGCPNAVCEAMARARPVVATDIPGCRQALGLGGQAWLAAPEDAEAMASLIIRMLGDAGLRQQAGTLNRQRIVSDFSIASMNDFFQRTIEEGLKCRLS